MEKHAYILEKLKINNKPIVKCMVICRDIIILLLLSLILFFFINLNILNIDVFSLARNQHQENIYIIIDLKTKNKNKSFNIMQIAYTKEFGKVRNLNDIVREFP